MSDLLKEISRRQLVWLPEKGIGYYPAIGHPYDRAYFDKYVRMAETPMGGSITQARIDMVARHYIGPVVDVGIGCGDFVERRPNTLGYDINPSGIEWLKERKAFVDISVGEFDAVAFWDSLEHIQEPLDIVGRVRKWMFVSIPIFRDCEHLLTSHHYRKDEHYWYFTEFGFVSFVGSAGFELVERNEMETELGRDSIMSFAFRRIRP